MSSDFGGTRVVWGHGPSPIPRLVLVIPNLRFSLIYFLERSRVSQIIECVQRMVCWMLVKSSSRYSVKSVFRWVKQFLQIDMKYDETEVFCLTQVYERQYHTDHCGQHKEVRRGVDDIVPQNVRNVTKDFVKRVLANRIELGTVFSQVSKGNFCSFHPKLQIFLLKL